MAELQRVDIYVETDSRNPAACERYGGYVLEYIGACGEPETREDFFQMTGTYHGVVLERLTTALCRMRWRCEVHIHTQDAYILNMVDKFLTTWAAFVLWLDADRDGKNEERKMPGELGNTGSEGIFKR